MSDETWGLVGKTLGDYRIERKLESGGMADIYIGWDERLEREAAIKILPPAKLKDDPVLVERFNRETRTVARLDHENIITIYQFGEQDGIYFMAMQYIKGQTLGHVLRHHKRSGTLLAPKRAFYILRQVADALDHAHEYGIIHRDVKPSNVLLNEKDKAILSDFGLVMWQSADETRGEAFGTPRYISPEQATDSRSAVPQSDTYSLAVIAYEALTNAQLFTGDTPIEVAMSHVTKPPPPPRQFNPDLSPQAEAVLLKALAKEPENRYPTARAFVDALEAAYGVEDGDTSPLPHPQPQAVAAYASVTDPPTVVDQASRRVMPLLVLGLVIVVMGVGLGLFALTNNDADSPTLAAALDDNRNDNGQTGLATETQAETELVATATPEPPTPTFTAEPTVTPTSTLTPMLVPSPTVVTPASVALPLTQGTSAPVTLLYNENFFALRNDADEAIDLSGLAFSGGADDRFTLPNSAAIALQAGDCIIIRLTSASGSPPNWACRTQGRAAQINPVRSIFWQADDASDTAFVVQRGTSALQRCDTLGRLIGRTDETTCTVQWPT